MFTGALIRQLNLDTVTRTDFDRHDVDARVIANYVYSNRHAYTVKSKNKPAPPERSGKVSNEPQHPSAPYRLPPGYVDITTLPLETPAPRNRRQAQQSSELWPHCYAAECVEVETLAKHGVAELVDPKTLPKDTIVLPGRFAYAIKKGPRSPEDPTIVCTFMKARYTGMGCFQPDSEEGVGADVYAPVTTFKTLRILLQLVNSDPDWKSEQWDVVAAYINALMRRRVVVEQPHGHEDPERPHWVWLLRKALYGIREAGYEWKELLREILLTTGAKPCPADPAIYVLRDEDAEAYFFMPSYVDDLWPIYNKAGKRLRDKVYEQLSKYVSIKCEGEIDWILKTKIIKDVEKGILKISQESFVLELLSRTGMLNCKGKRTPAATRMELPNPDTVTDEEVREMQKYPIREVIGSLMWLISVSRPDIMVATQMVARGQHRPSKALWKAITRILRYLKEFPHLGVVMTRPKKGPTPTRTLEIWVDASLGPNQEVLKGKSIIGMAVFFMGALVHWASTTTRRIADSASDAECQGLNEARRDNIFYRSFLHLLGNFPDLQNEPTVVWEDNTSAISLSGTKTHHKRSRHYGLEWYATKEAVEKGEMTIAYVETTEQHADFFTKTLDERSFTHHRNWLMGNPELQAIGGTKTKA